jgi:hypothetical protein
VLDAGGLGLFEARFLDWSEQRGRLNQAFAGNPALVG